MRKERARSRPDIAIARIAGNQHGVITAAQIAAAGLSPAGITRRLSAGRLHRIHRGVYAVGHRRLSNEGRWMAAVLTCGEGAILSHRSAAEHWGIRRRDRRPSVAGGRGDGVVEVTVPGDAGRAKRGGIKLYRSQTLLPKDSTRLGGIPVTTPSRTLKDLRTVVGRSEFGTALREAEFLRLPIGNQDEHDGTRTRLEARFLALCMRHRLPQPEVNVKLDRFEVDFLWKEQRLVVEVDGWESHRSRSAFEDDRARDARLAVLGYRVVRFTWRRVIADGPDVTRTIRSLLR
jgi:very-short-patch-repair endonuclease